MVIFEIWNELFLWIFIQSPKAIKVKFAKVGKEKGILSLCVIELVQTSVLILKCNVILKESTPKSSTQFCIKTNNLKV